MAKYQPQGGKITAKKVDQNPSASTHPSTQRKEIISP